MQYEKDAQLFSRGIAISRLQLDLEKTDVDQLATRDQIAKDQIASHDAGATAQTAVAQSTLDQARAILALTKKQHDELHVRAGIDGVLQLVPVDVGQQVTPGTNLARVANPSRLKAEIKVAETQAKDIQVGQKAAIDTRVGIVNGMVARIDPSVQNGTRTVDVSLNGEMPKGAVPDLSVEGTIELERLADVLYMGRPAFGQEHSTVTLFRVNPDGEASRVQVKLGRESVNSVEILSGLNLGDRVILSDMSAWDGFDRIKLK
jgi:HlyD family secretion protein